MAATKMVAVSCVLLSVLTVAGCANIKDINKRITSIDVVTKKPPDAEYVVDPPDEIRVEFLTDASATRTVVLRSDGRVTLPHLEDIKVSGLTTIQIREKLETLYSRFYKDPRILVTVTRHSSKHVYVYGEVRRPGAIPYTGTMTVSDLMGKVGGYSTRAAAWRARAVRRDAEHTDIFRVNLRKLMYAGDITQEVSLAEDDILYVPPTCFAWVGYQIESLIFPFTGATSARGTFSSLASPVP